MKHLNPGGGSGDFVPGLQRIRVAVIDHIALKRLPGKHKISGCESTLSFLENATSGCSNRALAGTARVREPQGSVRGAGSGRQVLRIVRLQLPSPKTIER